MSWSKKKLGDVLTLKRGYDLPNARREPGNVPVVSSSGITGSHNSAKAEGPGVVTGRYGTLGEVFFVTEDFWPLNTALYVRDFKDCDRRFASYFLRHVLRGTTSNKAAVPGVNRNDLHARDVLVPDPGTQVEIARILSAYDDLIANNQRRIQLLEESARLLFKEWFVHLRFPGSEHVKVVDGLPSGWDRKPLAQLCIDVREPVDPKSLPGDTPYIGLEHIPRRSITMYEWATASEIESNKFKFSSGDILFGKIRPYFHKVGLALVEGIASSDAIVIRPTEDILYHYVLFLVSSDEFVALASKTVREGAKMPRADWKFLQQTTFNTPPESLLAMFSDFVAPVCDQLRHLALATRQLSDARDLFLPRLMSGELAA